MTTYPGASVLVTGGSRGIGKVIALRFAELGASRVAIGYLRSDAAAEAAAEELRALGAEPVLIRGNVSARVLEEVALLGPLDVLVHNAATGVIRPAIETEDKHWDWTLAANTRALLALTRVAPQMLPGASIIGISSLGAQRVLENYTLVGVSRPPSRRSSATSRSSWLRTGFASTPSRAASSRPARWSTSRTARRCFRAARTTPPGASSRPRTSPRPSPSSARRAEMIRGQTLIVHGGFSLKA